MTKMMITHGHIFVFSLAHVHSKTMAKDQAGSLTAVSHKRAIKILQRCSHCWSFFGLIYSVVSMLNGSQTTNGATNLCQYFVLEVDNGEQTLKLMTDNAICGAWRHVCVTTTMQSLFNWIWNGICSPFSLYRDRMCVAMRFCLTFYTREIR